MKIPVVRSHQRIPMLATAHEGDAGADLSASEEHTIEPGQTALVGTGLSMAIPPGHAGFVLPRSGLAIKHGITVANAPGLIDSGYRGEIRVGLINHSDSTFVVRVGDRIAQLVVMTVETPEFVEVDALDSTDRGAGGFGSTGVAGA
ncbi:MAG: dUTP diphosphatase [Armatimonadetes bacterium]|nr:MAG: dUTP diphosphatase [Armatimonadota bacterium]